jgi:hypothetical protein
MDDNLQEIDRLCRIIGEDKTTIAKLEEQRERLEDVIDKQNDLIETLWELYTNDQISKHY